ncbi:response regulator transcription factor [Paraburkholderia tropica]|uniref:response regulator transcription factor n=1 Tax=Paraburkholderia tropica TaxID=92647 RepID=UPI00158FE06E|nr:response regulator transcription factor [Paraburkholderia tropica]
MARVAIIEDHERLAGLLRQALMQAGIEADIFASIREATYGTEQAEYAVLIIDRGLPDGDGLTFLRTVRDAGRTTPCLMLTARDALHDRIEGLESGADDYVSKPFEMSEFVARVRTLMRRPAVLAALIASFGDITVDPQQRALTCRGRVISLAPAELQIILSLIQADGRTVRHSILEHAAWGFGDAVTPNALEVTVHRLRKKLIEIGAKTHLMNVRGAGFMLRED